MQAEAAFSAKDYERAASLFAKVRSPIVNLIHSCTGRVSPYFMISFFFLFVIY